MVCGQVMKKIMGRGDTQLVYKVLSYPRREPRYLSWTRAEPARGRPKTTQSRCRSRLDGGGCHAYGGGRANPCSFDCAGVWGALDASDTKLMTTLL